MAPEISPAVEQVELESEPPAEFDGAFLPGIGGHGREITLHEAQRGYQPRIGGALLARLQRAEAQVEQHGDDQQAPGQHDVRADEQSALAGCQPFLQAPTSQASGTSR